MDEVLNKLLQSELLSEESRAEISEQWTQSVEAFRQLVREEEASKLLKEFSVQWLEDRDQLITKVDGFVSEALTRELAELQSDISEYHDLKAELAERLVEEKHRLAEEVAKELDALVDKIDDFFEVQLTRELDELREDLALVKQNKFGADIFEAFVNTYARHYVDENSIQTKLSAAVAKAADLQEQLARAEDERAQMVREAKMEKVLAPLTGKKREQMAIVLKNVETSRLDESYNYFISRILREEAPATQKINEAVETTTVVTGDPAGAAVETAKPVVLSEDTTRAKRLAGIKS